MIILDEDDNKPVQRNAYSHLSLIFGVLTLILIIVVIVQIPPKFKVSDGFPMPSLVYISLIHLANILGLTTTILASVKKEPFSWAKIFGRILVILLCLFICGTILFAKITDLSH